MFQNNLLLPNTPHNLATGWITTLFGTTKEHHGHVFIWKCCRSSLEVDRKCWKMPLAKHHRKIMLAFVRLFSVPFSFFPVNSLNHCFFSMFFLSFFPHTMLHLKQSNSPGLPSMMYNAEWLDTISKRAFSNHSRCMHVWMRVLLTEGELFFCQYLESRYLLLSLCRWLGKPPSIFY